MSDFYKKILDNNKAWVEQQLAIDKDYFNDLAKGHRNLNLLYRNLPHFLRFSSLNRHNCNVWRKSTFYAFMRERIWKLREWSERPDVDSKFGHRGPGCNSRSGIDKLITDWATAPSCRCSLLTVVPSEPLPF